MGILGFEFLRAVTGGLFNVATAEHSDNVFDQAITHFGKLAL